MSLIIEPEVAGELGQDTELDNSIHPPLVEKLHFEFNGWLGDDLLECFPCFIVTKQLKERIDKTTLTGIVFDKLKITRSEIFVNLYPEKELPIFYWAKIIGIDLNTDFSLAKDYRLIVSERAFKILDEFQLKNALVEESPSC